MLNVLLFHGRETTDEVLTDWGEEGPLLGPLDTVNITYGEITLYPATDATPPTLQLVDGLIPYGGMFYGDLEVTSGRRSGAELPREDRCAVEPRLLEARAERPSIVIPPAALQAYLMRVAVFVDSVREIAGDSAAQAAQRALMQIVKRKRRR
jgi:hypothetical protein